MRDAVRGGPGLHSKRFLAPRYRRRVAARQQDYRRTLAHSGGGHGWFVDDHGAGRVGQIAGDAGHHPRGGLAGRERDGQSDRARRLDDGMVGTPTREGEKARRPGASQTVDDDVGDGGAAARHFFAKPSNTGRMRSSALLRLASEFAYENRR